MLLAVAVATGKVDRPPSLILRFLRIETLSVPHGRICPQRWLDMEQLIVWPLG